MNDILSEPYELIISVVNNGYTDLVMEGARKAGARGGTVLTARGTGNPEIEKFFGVVITPEKEVVLILVKEELRADIMRAVAGEFGLDSPGKGIVFSLPVEESIGLNFVPFKD